MAAVTILAGSIQVGQFTTPSGPNVAVGWNSNAGAEILGCFVSLALTGTYVQGTGYSLTAATIATAIANTRRDGTTITIEGVSTAAPGNVPVSSVDTFVFAGSTTPASNIGSASYTGLLYTNDLATEWAAAAMGTFTIPLMFYVTFVASPVL